MRTNIPLIAGLVAGLIVTLLYATGIIMIPGNVGPPTVVAATFYPGLPAGAIVGSTLQACKMLAHSRKANG